MTRKHTSATDVETPIKVVLVTLDNHVNGAIARAEKRLTHDLPGIDFTSFAATEWEADPQSLSDCRAAIAQGDIVIVTMLDIVMVTTFFNSIIVASVVFIGIVFLYLPKLLLSM